MTTYLENKSLAIAAVVAAMTHAATFAAVLA